MGEAVTIPFFVRVKHSPSCECRVTGPFFGSSGQEVLEALAVHDGFRNHWEWCAKMGISPADVDTYAGRDILPESEFPEMTAPDDETTQHLRALDRVPGMESARECFLELALRLRRLEQTIEDVFTVRDGTAQLKEALPLYAYAESFSENLLRLHSQEWWSGHGMPDGGAEAGAASERFPYVKD